MGPRRAVAFAAALTHLEKYLDDHRKLLNAATVSILQGIDKNGNTTLGDVAYAVHKQLKLPEHILEWRVAYAISTAYHMGAFSGSRFELRRGVGFAPRKTHLRAVS